jgi:hypothetical protein
VARIERLPRVVGVAVDPQFAKPDWIQNLIHGLKPNSILATATGDGIETWVLRTALVRADINVKTFELEPWEGKGMGKNRVIQLRDYMLLSYIKFHKGHLFIFPKKFENEAIGRQYNERMQNIIILARQLRLKYDIIEVGED